VTWVTLKKILRNIFSAKREGGRIFFFILGMKISAKCGPFFLVSKKTLIKYIKTIRPLNAQGNPEFIPETHALAPELTTGTPKVLAFYLPQFHPFAENNEWHGKGFTEWTNVAKAVPLFEGHYQPHIPYHFGFYNPLYADTLRQQTVLAQQYGISGFSFYYYWFSGKRIMEAPVFHYLRDKSIDFPFCLTWACDTWTKAWDGASGQILLKSEIKAEDHKHFFADILPFVEDERYIKVKGCPLLLIYNIAHFEEEKRKNFVRGLQQLAGDRGFQFHIAIVLTRQFYTDPALNITQISPQDFLADSFVEFPPHGLSNSLETYETWFRNPCFQGRVFDMQKFLFQRKYEDILPGARCHRTIFPCWDNTARRLNGDVYYGVTPDLYREWLSFCLKYTRQNFDPEERFMFVNAWNEWGEGAHLEPDLKHGFAFLEATRLALQDCSEDLEAENLPSS
jgi:hypothetical protein